MAKFKAGDFITGQLEFSETDWIQDEYGEWEQVLHEWTEVKVYLVNRVIPDTKYGPMYSLDNGDGFIDSRSRVVDIDAKFELCN